MDVTQNYRDLHAKSGNALEAMLTDATALATMTTSHNYLLDFDRLKSAIASRPEVEVLNAAVKEYQFALFALSCGQYRHAFIGLRLFYELMLATIQFSAHELDFRMWARDTKDINWNTIKDIDKGVFAVNFINAFNPTFSEHAKPFLAISEAVYRECSEFVHGNAHTHITLPSDISFQVDIFNTWHQKAEIMRISIIFAYSARYLNYVDSEEQEMIEPVVLDAIGNLPAVQAIFSKPVQ